MHLKRRQKEQTCRSAVYPLQRVSSVAVAGQGESWCLALLGPQPALWSRPQSAHLQNGRVGPDPFWAPPSPELCFISALASSS